MPSWSASDQAVYDALLLDASLGRGAAPAAATMSTSSLTERRTRGRKLDPWYKYPRLKGMVKDPVWFLVRLVWVIPYNILYISFQVLRTWAGRTSVMAPIARGDLVLGHQDLAVNVVVGAGPGGVRHDPYRLRYPEIRAFGQYDNGILLDGRRPRLLSTPADPEAFVRLTHLVPAAHIAHGLRVRPDFEQACAAQGLSLAHLPACRNVPETWSRSAGEYVPPMPWERKLLIGLAAGVAVLVLISLVRAGVLG